MSTEGARVNELNEQSEWSDLKLLIPCEESFLSVSELHCSFLTLSGVEPWLYSVIFLLVCHQERLLLSLLPAHIARVMKAEIIQRLKGPNFGQMENTNNFHNLYVQRHTNVRHVVFLHKGHFKWCTFNCCQSCLKEEFIFFYFQHFVRGHCRIHTAGQWLFAWRAGAHAEWAVRQIWSNCQGKNFDPQPRMRQWQMHPSRAGFSVMPKETRFISEFCHPVLAAQ